ncbi:MAG: hypothetical protein K0S08_2235 [Gammaproteobacteria bacterium]|jgi:hypothetical protein|nr:hypothetical protein [Gammaproteobacteria bacterium]
MSKYDLSFEESLQEKTHKGGVQRKLPAKEMINAPWLEMIYDLVVGAGFSYSRIAYRLNVSPSTIQKLMTFPGRRPRAQALYDLEKLYYKVFQGQYASPKARAYWSAKHLSEPRTQETA